MEKSAEVKQARIFTKGIRGNALVGSYNLASKLGLITRVILYALPGK